MTNFRRLVIASCIFLALSACSKGSKGDDPQSPIQGLELPDASDPLASWETITLKGQGFTQSSEIRLTAAGAQDIKVTITEVGSGFLKFTVPNTVSGTYSVILKQNGKEYTLGTLVFETASKSEKIFATGYSDYGTLYEYNKQSGLFVSSSLKDDIVYNVVVDNDGVIYYNSSEKSAIPYQNIANLCSYNPQTRARSLIKKDWLAFEVEGAEGLAIGLIRNKLHGIKYNETDGFTLVSIATDGKETLVKKFGKINGSVDYTYLNTCTFLYDKINDLVLFTTWAWDGIEERATIVSLSLSTGSIKTKTLVADSYASAECFQVNGEVWLTIVKEVNEQDITEIRQINPSTLETMKTVKTLNGIRFYSPNYVPRLNAIYGIVWRGEDQKVQVYDPVAGTFTTVKDDTEFDSLFVVSQK